MRGMAERLSESMLTAPLGRYQVDGVRFFYYNKGNAICADAPGVGKTWQGIGYLSIAEHLRPALIVCPSGMKYKWQRELMEHGGLDSDVAEGKTPHYLSSDIWIINYEILQYWVGWLLQQGIKITIPDEAHRLANPAAKRTIAFVAIARKAQHTVALTGTPIRNRPIEFFTVLNLVAPTIFPSHREYAYRYCGPRPGFRGAIRFDGATNLKELHGLIDPLMIRRTKEQVLKYLPQKHPQVIPIKIHMTEYIKARDNFLKWLEQNKGASAARRAASAEKLVRMSHLKQLAAAGKKKAIKTWLDDFLLDNPTEKMILFSVHRQMSIDFHQQYRNNSLMVLGGISARAKQDAVDRFQTDPTIRFMFGNIAAIGEGVTLTAASTVGFAELAWTPADHEQAGDRILRHGQTAKNVNEYWFIAMNTIEDHLVNVLQTKKSVIGQVIEGREEEDVINFLISKLLEEGTK